MGNVVTPEYGAERRRASALGAVVAVALAVACASGKPVRVAEAPVEPAASPAASGASAPITIRSLDVAEGAPEAFLNLEGNGPLVWTSYRDTEGRVVLELPNAVPGAAVTDLAPEEGLIEMVLVERGQEGGQPLTRLVVATREQVEHAVTADGPRLQLRLLPLEEETVAATMPPPVAAPAPGLIYEPLPERGGAAAEDAAAEAAEGAVPEAAAETLETAGTAESPAVAPAPRGAAATVLVDVRASTGDGDTLVRLEGDGELPYATFLLEQPTRFVIDLPGVTNRTARASL
ncbi:MAG TPA: hypothetical protein VF121_17365, partial [Thermoanaerobaculia bacterium]|nr:hypothetical protein [Thermoanaerobaculia bacterium]